MLTSGAGLEFDWLRELNSGEKLLWSGRPPQGIRLRWMDLFFVPFGIVFMTIPLVGVIAAFNQQGPEALFALIFITPFVLIGGFVAFGRFIVEKKQRAKTDYAITNERLLIRSGLWRSQLKSLDLVNLSDITFTEYGNGGGRITLGSVPWMFAMQSQMDPFGMMGHMVPTLELTSDARTIYDQLRTAKRAAREQQPERERAN
jgi:hypothetical protein